MASPTTGSNLPEELGPARIICELVMMVLIALEPVKNRFLQVFVRNLLLAFTIELVLVITHTTLMYVGADTRWDFMTWRCYEIIRVFISLALCYPIFLVLGEDVKRLQRIFAVVAGIVLLGAALELSGKDFHPGLNNFAFLVVFSFTYTQYQRLGEGIQGGEIPRLNSLKFLEACLIALVSIVLGSLYLGLDDIARPAKIAIGILQFIKFYMIVSVMGHFA